MNKKQQIVEIAKIIHKGELDRNSGDLDCTEFETALVVKLGLQRLAGAKALYEASYRKQGKGEWILVKNGHGVCSVCNRQDNIDSLAHFCRYCGARMRKVVTRNERKID